jgi:predicted MFS family arabinose efflux permease
MGIYMVKNENTKTTREEFYHFCQISSATLFTIGSLFMVWMAHNMPDQPEPTPSTDRNWAEVSCLERYVTGNSMLLATWFFAISVSPFLFLGIYIIAIAPTDPMGYLYVICSFGAFSALGVWVLGSMDENLAKDGGLGSTILYDNIFVPIAGSESATLNTYFKRDLINGMWIFFFAALLVFPYGIYYVATVPTEPIAYYCLVMAIGFVVGAGQMVYTSFPENYGSTVTFDFFTCYTCRDDDDDLVEVDGVSVAQEVGLLDDEKAA